MTDWIATLIPVGSLILGGALTILGQHLADRRTLKRDRENRREEFRKIAFEHERPALLELQEQLAIFSQTLHGEKRRRDAERYYEYIDITLIERNSETINADFRRWTDAAESAALNIASYVKDITNLLNSPNFKKDSIEHRTRLNDLMAKMKESSAPLESQPELMSSIVDKEKEQIARLLEMGSQFERSSDFAQEFIDFIPKARLKIYRSGSNPIVNNGEGYIQAVAAWAQNLNPHHENELWSAAIIRGSDLYRAVSNVLHSGPYYDPEKD